MNFTIQAFSGIPTIFNTLNTTVQAGTGGTGGFGGGLDGLDGSVLGNSIFLRTNSALTLMASDIDDLLTVGENVSFTDDTSFGEGNTNIYVLGNGTVIYNGTTDYQGTITINNANFKVNGQIDEASIFVCRNRSFSLQRGTLSGSGTLTGDVYVNSGIISPDTEQVLTLGSLTLNPATEYAIGSLVHIEIDSTGTSLVAVTGPASLAGILEFDIDSTAVPGTYRLLTSSGITGTFDSVAFTGATPMYSLSYLPSGAPTFVQFDFLGYLDSVSNFTGEQKKNNFGLEYELYNQLRWTTSLSPQVTGYFIYRDGEKIATVDASTDSYQDHNRPRGVSFVYSLVAFDNDGSMSLPVTVT